MKYEKVYLILFKVFLVLTLIGLIYVCYKDINSIYVIILQFISLLFYKLYDKSKKVGK